MSDHRIRFTLIEAARGVAALLVVLYHAGDIIAEPRFYGTDPFGGHLHNFNVGVDFFFVLSGFIITWVHWDDLGHRERIGSYARKRFLRVFPPYWGVLLFVIALYAFAPDAGQPHQHDPLNIAFSVVLFPWIHHPVLGVAWTLTYEIFFYVLFAIAVAAGRRVLPLFGLWAIAILAAHAAEPLSYPASFLLSPFNLEFILGLGAAALLRQHKMPAPALLLAAGTIGFPLLMLLATHIQDDPLRGRLAFGIASLLFVLGAVELERQRRVAVPKVMIFLGASSYVIYLVHPVALSFGAQVLRRLAGHALPVDLLVLLLASVGAAAGIAYHLTAEPLLTRWARRLLDRVTTTSKPANSRSSL